MAHSFLILLTVLSIFNNMWESTADYFAKQGTHFSSAAKEILGETRLFLLGLFPEENQVATFGHGEISNNLRITAINGILNQKKDWELFSNILSETHGNINVHSVFWPSEGWIKDLHKCVVTNTGTISSCARQLCILWRQMIEEMGGIESDGIIIHYAHSIGSLETHVAKYLMTPQELKKIKVITFGAPYLYEDEDFLQVTHYVSYYDGVCMFNAVAFIQHVTYPKPHIFFLNDTYTGTPLLDHFIAYGSYRDQLDILGAEFIQQYGYID